MTTWKQTYEEQYEALNRLLDEAVERRERFLESISPDNKWLTMMRGVAGMTGLTQEVVDAIIEKVHHHPLLPLQCTGRVEQRILSGRCPDGFPR